MPKKRPIGRFLVGYDKILRNSTKHKSSMPRTKEAGYFLKIFFAVLAVCSALLVFSPTKASAAQYVVTTGALADSTAGANQRKLVRTPNGDYHAVYHKLNADGFYQIYYAKSTDNGQTWTETTLISDPLVISISHDNRPSIVSDSQGNLYVVWWGKSAASPTYNQIRYVRFDHSTGVWSGVNSLTSGDYEQSSTSLTVDAEDNIYVFWNGKSAASPTYTQIRFAKYAAATSSWSEVSDVTSEGYDQQRPFVAVDYENALHLTWFGKNAASTGFTQIHYRKYSGGSWGAAMDVTSGDYTQDYTSLAIDSQNNVHLVWRGTDATSPAVSQIKYAKYTKATSSWGDFATFSTEQFPRGQYNPFISIDSSDNIYVAWNGRIENTNNAYVIRFVKYSSGSWSAPQALTGDVEDNQYPNLIWGAYPVIRGARVNRPLSGYAFIWGGESSTVYFYSSADLAWETQDITAPVRSGGSPTGEKTSDTRYVALSISTDENATCRYSAVSGTPYASMAGVFSTTDNRAHSATVSGLSSGTAYNYYVRCSDAYSNVNSDDYVISFTVAVRGGFTAYVPPPVSLRLVLPNGGSSYAAGQVTAIDWQTENGAFANYRLSYSADNGLLWAVIADKLDGSAVSYSWTVGGKATSEGLVKVEGLDSSGTVAAMAVSASTFAVSGAASAEPEGEKTPKDKEVPKTDPTASGNYDPIGAKNNNPTFNDEMSLPPAPPFEAWCVSGTLIKGTAASVYYCGNDGKRYVFANDKAYFSRYPDFSTVQAVSDEVLAKIGIGGNITYRPGVRLVKIQTDPKVYAVSRGGLLRWVKSEGVARRLYGDAWSKLVDDIPDAFFVDYKIGAPIE
jgi:hypothetical protein